MYLAYPSSRSPELKLFADFRIPDKPCHLRLHFHGWHGSVKHQHRDNVESADAGIQWFFIHPEMRGRGDSTGTPDCNGWELQDAIDAVEFARKNFADKILEPEKVYLSGGSGGGGNAVAVLGKFPDYFCRAHADCGIYDYAHWFRHDTVGEFRDEMEGKGWIGGDPDSNPEAYRSRSGAYTIKNLLTPLIVFHGENDIRVPAEQAHILMTEAHRHNKHHLISYFELPGCGGKDHWSNTPEDLAQFRESVAGAFMTLASAPPVLLRRGCFTVAGYLKTKEFEVELDSINSVGEVQWDLDRNQFSLNVPGRVLRKSPEGKMECAVCR